MTPGRRGSRAMRLTVVGALALAAGCAPFAPYRAERANVPRLPPLAALPGDVAIEPARDTVVALVYGDNRPGLRLPSNAWRAWAAFRGGGTGGPGRWLAALAAAPLLAVQAVIPSLDGPRDLVTAFTGRPRGGGETEVLAALERALPADIVVSTGDLVEDGRRGVQWEDFARRHQALREAAPYAAAPGNHERMHDPLGRANWEAVLGPPRAVGEYWYALMVRRARFVFLDSNVLADPHDHVPDDREHALAEAQLAWADSVLALPASHRFVVLHHPLVGTGHYLGDWASRAARERRARLLELCVRHRVDAVLAGHEHLYDRAYLAPAGGGAGVWQIVTGGGGSPLYPVDPARRALARDPAATGGFAAAPASERSRTAYHYVRLEIPPSGAPTLVAYEVSGRRPARPFDRVTLAPPAEEAPRP